MKSRFILSILLGTIFIIGTAIMGYTYTSTQENSNVITVLSILILLVAPYAGGFLAGLIARGDRHRIGVITGAVSSVIISIYALTFLDFNIKTILILFLLIVFWTFLARLGARMSGK